MQTLDPRLRGDDDGASFPLHQRAIVCFSQHADAARMQTRFDLIVVGASFAGAACALAAAQSGCACACSNASATPATNCAPPGIIVKEAAERTLLGELPGDLVRRVDEVRPVRAKPEADRARRTRLTTS
jgi:hypothetical protein